jgi:molecular chaperone GrpE
MAKKEQQEPKDQNMQEQQPPEQEGQQIPETKQEIIEITPEQYEQLKSKIEGLEKEREEYLNLAQRVQADFDNYRKRNAALRAESLEEGGRETIKELLPVLDGFDRAMESARQSGESNPFQEGVALVYKQLTDTLKKLGLSEIPSDGEQFDPMLHNAVMQAEGEESGKVLETFQKGYKVKDKVIRYSMVKVAQ